jgi:hypothetical protein
VGREGVLRETYGGDLEYFRALSPWALAEQHVDALRGATRLRMVIGDRDEMLAINREFHAHLTRLGIPHTFTVLPGVGHSPPAVLEALGKAGWSFYREAFGALDGGPTPDESP